MDHAAFAELIAGRALGDLDVTERRSVDAHLRSCADCRSLTRDLDGVLTELAFAATPRAVPAALGPAILSAIRRDVPPLPVDLDDAARSASRRSDNVIRPARFAGLGRAVGVGLAAAAVIAIAVLGFEVVELRDQLGDAQLVARDTVQQLATRETAMQVVADPAHASAWLTPSTTDVQPSALRVYVPGSNDSFLASSGLPATPDRPA